MRRPHLNESQGALVAARLAKLWTAQGLDSAANLRRKSVGRISDKAAGQVNISPRLVAYAAKVLQQGWPELITAVESGALAASTAAALAGAGRGGAEGGRRGWREGNCPQGPGAARRTEPGRFRYNTIYY